MEKNAVESHGKNSTFTFHNWKQKVNSKSPIFPAVDGFRLIRLSLGAGCVWSLSCLRFLHLRSSWNWRATGQEIALDSTKWVWTLNSLKKMLSCKPVRNRDWKQLPLVGSEKTPPVTQQGVPAGNTQQQKAQYIHTLEIVGLDFESTLLLRTTAPLFLVYWRCKHSKRMR